MKTIISTSFIAAAVFSLNLNASLVKFEPTDNTFNTRVCVVAAKQGIQEAKKLIADKNISFKVFHKDISCNGKSLRSFTKKMEMKRLAVQLTKVSN